MNSKDLSKLQDEIRQVIAKYDPDAIWSLFVKDSESNTKKELNEHEIDGEIEFDDQFSTIKKSEANDDTKYDKLMVASSANIEEALLVTIFGIKGIISSLGSSNSILPVIGKLLGIDTDSIGDDDYERFSKLSKFSQKYKTRNLNSLVNGGLKIAKKDEVSEKEKRQMKRFFKSKTILKYLQNKMGELKTTE